MNRDSLEAVAREVDKLRLRIYAARMSGSDSADLLALADSIDTELEAIAQEARSGEAEFDRRLGAHSVSGTESAMDELDAIIRQAERYTDLKVHGKEVDGCILVHKDTVRLAEQVYAEKEQLRQDFDRLADAFNRENSPTFMGEPAIATPPPSTEPQGAVLECCPRGKVEGCLVCAECEAASVPVSWEYRFLDGEDGPSRWIPVDPRDKEIIAAKAGYEVRPLYTTPPLTAPGAVEANTKLLAAVMAGMRMRRTDLIDDDFPEIRDAFDRLASEALAALTEANPDGN